MSSDNEQLLECSDQSAQEAGSRDAQHSEDRSEERSEDNGLWREWIKPLAIIVVTMLSFRSAIADWNHVPTSSMLPTIFVGDRIVVNKLAYDLRVPFTTLRLAEWSSPQRGDIVVFLSPSDGKRLVKRVVGLPGDVLSMRNHRLQVNGEAADYSKIDPGDFEGLPDFELRRNRFSSETFEDGDAQHHIMLAPFVGSGSSFGPLEVPAGHYFVMGDNRDDSADSRVFGFVDGERILGRATAVALSVDPERNYKPRWQRFFTGLD